MIKFLIVYLLFISSSFALDEAAKTAIAKDRKNVNRMVSDGKEFYVKLKKLHKVSGKLNKFRGSKRSKKCAGFEKEFMGELEYIKNTLQSLKHPFWGYMKGAAKFGEGCGNCILKVSKRFCPKMKAMIDMYKVIY